MEDGRFRRVLFTLQITCLSAVVLYLGENYPFLGHLFSFLNALGSSVENNVTLYEILPKRNLHYT